MAFDKDAFLAAMDSMTVMELNDLVKAIEEKFGVSAAAVAAPTAGPTPVHAYARATSRQRGAEAAAAVKNEPSSARAHALPPTHRSSRVLSCAVLLGLHILVLRRPRRRVAPPRHSAFAHMICLRSSVCVPLSTSSVMTGWNRPTSRRRAPAFLDVSDLKAGICGG